MALEPEQSLGEYADKKHLQRFGDIRIQKGRFGEDTLFYAWDAIPRCRVERCAIYDDCPFEKRETKRCHVYVQFLKSLSVNIYRNYSHLVDEAKLYRIGLCLMPLYRMLCKLYIEEYAVEQVVNMDDKGVRRANPIFKEIRDTINAISREWRQIGLSPIALDSGGLLDPYEDGDPYIHEQAEEEEDERESQRNSKNKRKIHVRRKSE